MPDPTTLDRTRFPPGTTLGGRYRVDVLLGAGGMADVYAALDLRLGRRVAVKVVSPGLAGDPDARARFMEEARTAAGLSHPGLVAVFDAGVEGDAPFLVMEHVEGRTLAQVLREETLPPARAVRIAAAIAEALAAIHARGLVHRDVKPGNVLIGSDGSVKVADLGIAAVASDRAAAMPAFGTPGYASPEQVRGEAVDGRADLYALGVIAYEMLSGRLPFEADTHPAYRRSEPVPPSQRNAAVPPALDAVVLTALADRPEARYRSIAEFRDALLDAARGAPTAPLGSPRTTPPGAHRPARPRRWRRVLTAAAAAILLVLAGTWLAAGTPFPGRGPSSNGLPAVSPRPTPVATTPSAIVPTASEPSAPAEEVAAPPPTDEGDDGDEDRGGDEPRDDAGDEPCDNSGPGNCDDRGSDDGGGHSD